MKNRDKDHSVIWLEGSQRFDLIGEGHSYIGLEDDGIHLNLDYINK